jgi:hypothetical protein
MSGFRKGGSGKQGSWWLVGKPELMQQNMNEMPCEESPGFETGIECSGFWAQMEDFGKRRGEK